MRNFIYKDGNFNVSDAHLKQISYNLPVEVSMVYKTRYVMFIELFRFLYDFLSLNLVIRRNYFETFLRKAKEFTEFFKDIKTTKSTLHGESSKVMSKVASLKDKINQIMQKIDDKEVTIRSRSKDTNDLELELRNCREEIDQVISEKDSTLDIILEHFERINGTDFTYILRSSYF